MATNSIRTNLSKDTTISEIKLLLGADREKVKKIVVVEGEDDTIFLSKFFNEDVILFESFSGKQGVEEIINTREICNFRVIGIRDKDYCYRSSNKRIFFYDRCCLEMMIIENTESFNNICHEYYKGDLESEKLKEFILNELYMLSMLRKYNEENNNDIKFRGLKFSDFIDNENRLIEDNLKISIMQINGEKSIDFNCLSEIPEDFSIEELLNITNGHDFINFFKVVSDRTRTSNKDCPNKKQLSRDLRISYNNIAFVKTDMYKSIKTYFNGNIWKC